MNTTIYYFSASGNSLKIAEQISAKMGKCQIISIPDILDKQTISDNSSAIGIITPVYAWGPPRIVKEFLEKVTFSKKAFIFSIANCGGVISSTLLQMDKILKNKGLTIHAGFSLKAPAYTLFKDELPVKVAKYLAGKRKNTLKSFDARENEILDIIKKDGVITDIIRSNVAS